MPLLVYGVVLPWNGDRGPSSEAKGWSEFMRVVPMHARERARLRSEHAGIAPDGDGVRRAHRYQTTHILSAAGGGNFLGARHTSISSPGSSAATVSTGTFMSERASQSWSASFR